MALTYGQLQTKYGLQIEMEKQRKKEERVQGITLKPRKHTQSALSAIPNFLRNFKALDNNVSLPIFNKGFGDLRVKG